MTGEIKRAGDGGPCGPCGGRTFYCGWPVRGSCPAGIRVVAPTDSLGLPDEDEEERAQNLAQAVYEQIFAYQVDPYERLPPEQRARRAKHAEAAHYARAQLNAAKIREGERNA